MFLISILVPIHLFSIASFDEPQSVSSIWICQELCKCVKNGCTWQRDWAWTSECIICMNSSRTLYMYMRHELMYMRHELIHMIAWPSMHLGAYHPYVFVTNYVYALRTDVYYTVTGHEPRSVSSAWTRHERCICAINSCMWVTNWYIWNRDWIRTSKWIICMDTSQAVYMSRELYTWAAYVSHELYIYLWVTHTLYVYVWVTNYICMDTSRAVKMSRKIHKWWSRLHSGSSAGSRPIGWRILQVLFRLATDHRALLWKEICKNKPSFGVLPPSFAQWGDQYEELQILTNTSSFEKGVLYLFITLCTSIWNRLILDGYLSGSWTQYSE